ncbi:uncharacterized protein LOC141651520 [Silene latifolia]|uniref:uncharacterized protein LOC141651520 n=1 Tax=Silene latifolia TaxID=37657 RepID=UPI003D77A39D
MAGDDTDTNPPVVFPRIDPSNPYYLGSQDGPGAKISNIELRHDNYDVWHMSMKMSLKSRRKFGFVDGTIEKPTKESDLENWEAVHCTLVQWIRNTISPSLLDNVTYGYDASILWAELESQFAVVDGMKIHNLKTQLKNFKQTKDATLYGNIRSQQFQLDPLPTLNRAYNIVLQEERLRSESVPDVSDVSAFALSSANDNSAVDWRVMRDKERAHRRPLFCSHCETRGHAVATCFFKTHRFPDWWGNRPRTLAEYRQYWDDEHGRLTWFGDKFAKKGRKCVFVGYPSNKKGWKLYDLETKSFFVSRDVVFHETEFPFITNEATTLSSSPTNDSLPYDELFDESLSYDPGTSASPDGAGNSTLDGSGPTTGGAAGTVEIIVTDPSSETEAAALGRGHRLRFPNSRLRGYILDTTHSPSPSPSPPSSPTSSSGTSYHLANYINCNSFSERHRNFLATVTMGVEPPSFKDAIRDDGWCEAMKLEIDALERNATWELSDLPPDKKALGCRWIYKIKYRSDGSIERLKARLVVFGNHQIEGLDYGETFAPVVKMVTVRILLAIAAINKWELHQMDVHNAFLHGDLDEEVYMKIPPGFSRGKEGKVCRLKKSLYGLRQAPRCWFAKLTTALKDYGFKQSHSDYSLFSYSQNQVRLFILVYVDDPVIAGMILPQVKFQVVFGHVLSYEGFGTAQIFFGSRNFS